jgi:hypothetical protein
MRWRSLLVVIPLLVAGLVSSTITGAAPSTWTEIGTPITGGANDDFTGWGIAVSGDGSRIAIGSTEDGTGNGRVEVLDWNGTGWTQVGATLVGEALGDRFGFSVDLSTGGTRLAVAAPNNAAGGTMRGSVRVFELVGSTWTQLGGDIDGNVNNAVFGHAIALSGSGSRLAVGAPDAASGAGKVQAYDWNGSAWVQHFSNLTGDEPGDWFGYSLDLSADGNRLAVGAGEHDLLRGHVRVFDWSGVGWVQAGADLDGVSEGDRSGRAVALSADGTVVAVASPFRDGAGTERGQVRAFGWSGSAWTQVGADLDGTEDGADFGYAIALSADGLRLVVGVPYASVGGAASGQAFAFDWNGSAWVQAGASIDGLTTNSFAGRSIALSGSGTRLLFGAPYDGAGSTAIGLVRVFDFPRPVAPVAPAYTG